MKVSASSSPELIAKKWNDKVPIVESLMITIREGSAKKVPINSVLDQLEKARLKLKVIYKAAIGRVAYENSLRGRASKYICTGFATLFDTGCQVVSGTYWGELLTATHVSSTNAIAVAVSTLASMGASKIKDRIWERSERHVLAVSKIEEIIQNKLFIKECKATITLYKHSVASRPTTPEIKQPVLGTSRFGLIVHRVMASNGEKKEDAKLEKLKERYITKLCGVYSRLNGEEIETLIGDCADLKKVMIQEEEIIEDVLDNEPNANVMAIIHQLENQLKDLKNYIANATLIIGFQEQLKKARSKYCENGFRVGVQFLTELGTLASAVTMAVYAYLGSSSRPAKIAGVSLFVIDIVLSWINTAFSKEQEIAAQKLQNLKRVTAQAVYAGRVEGLIIEAKKMGEFDRKQDDLVIDRIPRVGQPGSPLRECIVNLFKESTIGGDALVDWRTVIPKTSSGRNRTSSIETLMIPAKSPVAILQSPRRQPEPIALNLPALSHPAIPHSSVPSVIDVVVEDCYNNPVLDDLVFA